MSGPALPAAPSPRAESLSMNLDVHGQSACIATAGPAFDPALPSIVLVHGALNDHTVWDPLLPHLADAGRNVLAVDLPGHGGSAGPALGTVEAMADWLLALLDAAGIDRALLTGHSMGSLVALEAARRAPQRVRGLALLGTVWPMPVADALLAGAVADEATAIGMVTKWSHAKPEAGDAAGNERSARLQDATRALMMGVAQGGSPGLMHTDFSACNAYAGGAAAAAALACPVLFVLGERDVMTPARSARALAAGLPQEQVLVVSVDAGHAMMAEQPGAVGAALADFARTLNSTTLD